MIRLNKLRNAFTWATGRGHAVARTATVLAAVAIVTAYLATREFATTGQVGLTVTMPGFSPDGVVKVGSPATTTPTATLGSNYNPPVPPADEGSLTKSYAWSLTVLFSGTAAGTFADAGPPGPNNYTYTPTPIPSAASVPLVFTPEKAGYWKVSMSCTVIVTDTKNGQKWKGPGGAGPEPLTSAIVTFSPSPIKTGADASSIGAIFVKVTATVSPKDFASHVRVNSFTELAGGTGKAGSKDAVPNDTTGTVVFDLYGLAGTNKTMPGGDLKVEAKGGVQGDVNDVLGSDLVIVKIPAAIGTPHPQKNPGIAVMPLNVDLSATSVPAWQGVPGGDVLLGTLVEVPLTIPVVDQFGQPLSSLYNGQAVKEGLQQGVFVGINVVINSGSYVDHVGYEGDNGTKSLAATGSPAANAWPTSNQHDNIASPQSNTASVQVRVAGFTLNPSVVNRTISYSNGVLTVTWP